MPVALITGASRGFGHALVSALSGRGWQVVADARNGYALEAALDSMAQVIRIPGDVTDPAHRQTLGTAIATLGRLDLLINNASDLGTSPLPTLATYPTGRLRRVFETNVFAPLELIQSLLPTIKASDGAVVNISSDAAREPYETWGGYGSSKAALDQLTSVLGAEEPDLAFYSFDPGDMRTAMHQEAFPGIDISDRPEPDTVVPALLRLIDGRPASGRYRAADWLAASGAAS